MSKDRIELKELAAQLGPGTYDLGDETIIVADGAGNELTVQLGDATLEVKDTAPRMDPDKPITVDIEYTYEDPKQ